MGRFDKEITEADVLDALANTARLVFSFTTCGVDSLFRDERRALLRLLKHGTPTEAERAEQERRAAVRGQLEAAYAAYDRGTEDDLAEYETRLALALRHAGKRGGDVVNNGVLLAHEVQALTEYVTCDRPEVLSRLPSRARALRPSEFERAGLKDLPVRARDKIRIDREFRYAKCKEGRVTAALSRLYGINITSARTTSTSPSAALPSAPRRRLSKQARRRALRREQPTVSWSAQHSPEEVANVLREVVERALSRKNSR